MTLTSPSATPRLAPATAHSTTGVKQLRIVSTAPETVVWERAEGRVHVEKIATGYRVSLEPFDYGRQIGYATHDTAYPLHLIESIVGAKEFGNICDEMRRDESPGYVAQNLRHAILSFCPASAFEGKRVLDFGCGMGASTMRLATILPGAEIVGIELESYLLEIARKRKHFYSADNVTLLQSPSPDSLPPGLGTFDFIVFSALFEHLLPHERKTLLPMIWGLLNPGGVLFISETPHRWHFKEPHTTNLLLLNYLPDRLALWATRKFCHRYTPDVSWEFLLREGIRGGTVGEILGILKSDETTARLLRPGSGSGDMIDLWFQTSSRSKAKRLMRLGFKTLKRITGITFAPIIAIAIQKENR